MTTNNEDNDIIPAGMQVIDSRKNHGKEKKDFVPEPVIDPAMVKFYQALNKLNQEAKAAGKPGRAPMFRVELVHWDENGNIKKTALAYQTLGPANVATFADIINTRLSPPKPKGRVGGTQAASNEPATGGAPAAGGGAPAANDGTDVNGSEGDDEAAAAGGDDAGDEAAAAAQAEAEKKAAEEKAAAEKAAAEKKAAAAKPAKTTTPAANGNGAAPAGDKPKSAAERAREAAATAAPAAAAAAAKPPEEAKGEDLDLDHLFGDT